MVRSTDRPARTIAVDLGRKATKQTNKNKTCTEPTARMHKLMFIFVIIRFQRPFSREITVVSEFYCQNFKDKTSIAVMGKLLKCVTVAYMHMHMHEQSLD